MFQDIVKDIKASLYDRVSNPLLSSFIISWCIWNYQILLIIFGTGTIESKIKLLDAFTHPANPFLDNVTYATHIWWYFLSSGFAYPLLTTLFIIYILPYPTKWTYKFQLKKQNELKELKTGNELLSPEESNALKDLHHQLISNHRKEVEEYNQRIKRFEVDLSKSEVDHSESLRKNSQFSKKIAFLEKAQNILISAINNKFDEAELRSLDTSEEDLFDRINTALVSLKNRDNKLIDELQTENDILKSNFLESNIKLINNNIISKSDFIYLYSTDQYNQLVNSGRIKVMNVAAKHLANGKMIQEESNSINPLPGLTALIPDIDNNNV